MTRFTVSRSPEQSFTRDRQWAHRGRRNYIPTPGLLDEPSSVVSFWIVGFAAATFAASYLMGGA